MDRQTTKERKQIKRFNSDKDFSIVIKDDGTGFYFCVPSKNKKQNGG